METDSSTAAPPLDRPLPHRRYNLTFTHDEVIELMVALDSRRDTIAVLMDRTHAGEGDRDYWERELGRVRELLKKLDDAEPTS